jgi:hypothetical protein
MNKEEIINKRKDLDKRQFTLDKKYEKDNATLHQEYQILYSQCSHESINGGSYSRWCTNCGQSWDTT